MFGFIQFLLKKKLSPLVVSETKVDGYYKSLRVRSKTKHFCRSRYGLLLFRISYKEDKLVIEGKM